MDLEKISEACSVLGIVKGVPSVEGGVFTQEVGLDRHRIVGEFVLLSGFDNEDMELVEIGADVLSGISELDRDGVYKFHGGFQVAVIAGSKANQSISDNAAQGLSQHGSLTVQEFAPYDPRL